MLAIRQLIIKDCNKFINMATGGALRHATNEPSNSATQIKKGTRSATVEQFQDIKVQKQQFGPGYEAHAIFIRKTRDAATASNFLPPPKVLNSNKSKS